MKQIYLITIVSFLNLNLINSQTVTVDDITLGSLATYTFTYVTSNSIGVGTSTPNIIYFIKPTGYPNFVAVNPLSSFAPYAVVKVNGTEIPINSTNFGSNLFHSSLFLKLNSFSSENDEINEAFKFSTAVFSSPSALYISAKDLINNNPGLSLPSDNALATLPLS